MYTVEGIGSHGGKDKGTIKVEKIQQLKFYLR
jgi:hypothetical protein